MFEKLRKKKAEREEFEKILKESEEKLKKILEEREETLEKLKHFDETGEVTEAVKKELVRLGLDPKKVDVRFGEAH